MVIEILVDQTTAEAQTEAALHLVDMTDQNYIRLSAQSVVGIVKSLLSQMAADQFIVVPVLRLKVVEKIDHRETQDPTTKAVPDQASEETHDPHLMLDQVMMLVKET